MLSKQLHFTEFLYAGEVEFSASLFFPGYRSNAQRETRVGKGREAGQMASCDFILFVQFGSAV